MASDYPIVRRLQAGETVLGLAHAYADPTVIETMGNGWDFVWIDAQHGSYALRTDLLLNAVRAAEGVGIAAMIRVPGHDYSVLGPVADLAPPMIMVPMVNSAADARRVVQGLKFPPVGGRSFGGRRVYDKHGRYYFETKEPFLVAQIETPEAVENAADIAAVDGVDALLFGPDDMRMQMQVSMDLPLTESPVLREFMERTAKAAIGAGKTAAAIAPTVELFTMVHQLGYRMIVGGSDSMFVRLGAAAALQTLRPLTGEPGTRSQTGR